MICSICGAVIDSAAARWTRAERIWCGYHGGQPNLDVVRMWAVIRMIESFTFEESRRFAPSLLPVLAELLPRGRRFVEPRRPYEPRGIWRDHPWAWT